MIFFNIHIFYFKMIAFNGQNMYFDKHQIKSVMPEWKQRKKYIFNIKFYIEAAKWIINPNQTVWYILSGL